MSIEETKQLIHTVFKIASLLSPLDVHFPVDITSSDLAAIDNRACIADPIDLAFDLSRLVISDTINLQHTSGLHNNTNSTKQKIITTTDKPPSCLELQLIEPTQTHPVSHFENNNQNSSCLFNPICEESDSSNSGTKLDKTRNTNLISSDYTPNNLYSTYSKQPPHNSDKTINHCNTHNLFLSKYYNLLQPEIGLESDTLLANIFTHPTDFVASSKNNDPKDSNKSTFNTTKLPSSYFYNLRNTDGSDDNTVRCYRDSTKNIIQKNNSNCNDIAIQSPVMETKMILTDSLSLNEGLSLNDGLSLNNDLSLNIDASLNNGASLNNVLDLEYGNELLHDLDFEWDVDSTLILHNNSSRDFSNALSTQFFCDNDFSGIVNDRYLCDNNCFETCAKNNSALQDIISTTFVDSNNNNTNNGSEAHIKQDSDYSTESNTPSKFSTNKNIHPFIKSPTTRNCKAAAPSPKLSDMNKYYVTKSSKLQKNHRFPLQIRAQLRSFALDFGINPTKKQITALSLNLGLSRKQIREWFSNLRRPSRKHILQKWSF
ncbi:hypothetical protein BB561_003260 [Smittium simulii]|uniref:Homeobox domain-containing protein n=1 Tax=Smittium simulii TaxID=133385 RepID=A0A2T9YM88_9FUNG|nr:hypothetical protein BB561_003260 [Smittium simulii]